MQNVANFKKNEISGEKSTRKNLEFAKSLYKKFSVFFYVPETNYFLVKVIGSLNFI